MIDGNPVLIRLHSAASYPCESKTDNYKLDLESHAVLIVGFDDDTQTFDIVDSWNREEGSNKGIYKLPYELYPILCVNCSLSKDANPTFIKIDVKPTKTENDVSLKIKYGIYTPKGYIIDQYQTKLKNIELNIKYKINDIDHNYQTKINGEYCIGEQAHTIIPISKEINDITKFYIETSATIVGERPYKYEDNIKTDYSVMYDFTQKKNKIIKDEINKIEKAI